MNLKRLCKTQVKILGHSVWLEIESETDAKEIEYKAKRAEEVLFRILTDMRYPGMEFKP